ncbi:ferredoxin [Actinocorallia sp. A-T 12471]|uniref:ferredoxin n=1 Tax=Actinocorallia sp. A-T 12471 TaxID=3089813 RepID=UPI0029CCE1AB|nr:ferredoxin [Actinocorallia sp. A-T 12471]MDX6744088.1 ferredoxin [Actinocorallia sp. A-T 12471]
MVSVRADLAACRGAGQCVFTAPDMFDQDDADGTVVILPVEPDPDLAARAVRACPNGALALG